MISLVTITARDEPMLRLMADSIANAFAKHTPTLPLEWLIVDAALWRDPARAGKVADDIGPLPFQVWHIPPKPSRWHGPGKDPALGDRELPDTNGARNTGLIHAHGDYLVLLDDCSHVSSNFFAPFIWAREKNAAMSIWWERGTEALTWKPRGDKHHPDRTVATGGFRGSAVGYPIDYLVQVNGWDELFSGGRSGNDVEAAVRVERVGCPMYVDFRAGVLEHPHGPIFDRSSYFTEKNDELLDLAIADQTWIKARGNPFSIAQLRATLMMDRHFVAWPPTMLG